MDAPRHWRLNRQRYALIGEVCPNCQAKLFPPRDVCPKCGAPAKAPCQIEIGMPVEMTSRVLHAKGERGAIVYGYQFRPSGSS